MAARQPPEAPSPSTSSILLPLGRPRRGSFASITSRPKLDKETLASTLDQIHNLASRSDTLTTFDEFATPPRSSTAGEGKGLAGELVQGGLSGLYSRFKATVGVGRDTVARPSSVHGHDSADDASTTGLKTKADVKTAKQSAGALLSSPVILSTPSSRLQSPHTTQFADSAPGSPQVADFLSISVASPASTGVAKPLPTPHSKVASPVIEGVDSPAAADDRSRNALSATLQSGAQPDKSSHVHGADEIDLGDDDVVLERSTVPLNIAGQTHSGPDRTPNEPSNLKHDQIPFDEPDERILTAGNLPPPIQLASDDSVSGVAEEQAISPSIDSILDESADVRRRPLLQVSQSHLPGYRPSRATSSDGELSSVTTVAPARHATFKIPEEHHRRNHESLRSSAVSQASRNVLAKEFWMRDENAKDCFNCGDTFSTFRRKHHCRTCGQIFDAKCTVLVSGKLFGQTGNLRICKPCEAILNGNDDDSSVYSDEKEMSSPYSSIGVRSPTNESYQDGSLESPNGKALSSDYTKIATPVMGIPVSRRKGETKRRSAVIEFDGHPTLARPSSSRSLRSPGGRPRSSSHMHHHFRHQHMRSLKSSYDDHAPFQGQPPERSVSQAMLPAFHNDSIIDPDLAPFMSDEGSSEDEQLSIFAALSGNTQTQHHRDVDRPGLSGLLNAVKKGRLQTGEKNSGGLTHTHRDSDSISVTSKYLPRHARKRNLSVSSAIHAGPSPRRSKSRSLLTGFSTSPNNAPMASHMPDSHFLPFATRGDTRMIRSASLRGASAPPVELNRASLEHVRKMLRQLLQDVKVPYVKRWEKSLVPVLLRCTDDVNPDIQRHDDIDIRHYVKLKKVPGGHPGDTSYVSGVVFTKNVALKCMPRSISQPRIMLVTFAIEYARHQQHFMSLEPVIAQEREYLRNIVKRIAALNPQLLLAQKNVAGLALDLLEEAKIAVVYNVKQSVLNAVSRCTQARLISSTDKLSDPSHLGHCSSFDVKTYVHNGIKKTYVYLSGCQKDLGCTIVLRGAEVEVLRKVKRITEFMCFVVYNLKLETCLMRDEFALIPSSIESAAQSPAFSKLQSPTDVSQDPGPPVNVVPPTDKPAEREIQPIAGSVVEQIQDAGESPTAVPQNDSQGSITTHGAGVNKLLQESPVPHVTEDNPTPSFYDDMVEKHRTKILSASPFVRYMMPYLLMQAREQERRLGQLKRLRDQYKPDAQVSDVPSTAQKFELVKPEMVHGVVEKPSKQVRDFLYAVHDAEYDKAMHNYLTQKRQWEAYISSNPGLFDPFTHQRIAVLYSMVNSVTSTPCVGPEVIALGFYQEHDLDEGFAADIALGQYVGDLCHAAHTVCNANGCDRKLLDHHRQYVHGNGQISVIVQKQPSKIRGLHNTILMWSCCRVCGQETPVVPMSESTWKYSFGKYLELTFWSSKLHARAGICPHDINRDHVRYFGYHNIAIRIQYDSIQIYEVVVPRSTITWKVENDLRLKNDQFCRIKDRLDRFMASVKARIKSIHVETVIPEKVQACKAEVERLQKRANDEHEFLTKKLQDKYRSSKYYEVIPLNRACRAIQERVLAWDNTFVDFERNFFPSEKDIRRLATLQLKRLFLEKDESSTSITSIEEGTEDASTATTDSDSTLATNLTPLTRKPSEMSQEEAQSVLASVADQHQRAGDHAIDDSNKPQGQKPGSRLENTDASDIAPPEFEITPEIIEQSGVAPLDLAITLSIASDKPRAEDARQSTTAPNGDTKDETSDSIERPLESTQSAPEPATAIQQVQSQAATQTGSLDGAQESKIPRLMEPTRRDGLAISPPLCRTQSQPANVSRTEVNKGTLSSTANAATSKIEASRLNMQESARALERRMAERLAQGAFKPPTSGKHSLIPRSIPNKRIDSRVTTLAKHFEQLSREFERERLRERRQRAARSRQNRAYPLASSQPIVEVYRTIHEAVQESSPPNEQLPPTPPDGVHTDTSNLESSGTTSTTAPTTASQSPAEERKKDDSTVQKNDIGEPAITDAHNATDVEGEASDTEPAVPNEAESGESLDDNQIPSPPDLGLELSLELPKHEKTSLMKMLTSFWSERSASGWAPLEYPFASIEHVWEDSDIIVREDEPSSIIALALSCQDYQTKMHKFRQGTEGADSKGSQPGVPPASDEDASIERNLLASNSTNISYTFQNHGVRAQCKIFSAESFDALRRKCGVAGRFVESLSRCLKWDSKGGKTKSLFLKTLDDRFVLKSLSQIEVQAFFKFAPNYFAFMHQNLFNGLPSVIAKMFGLFQVTIKNPASGVEFNWFMLVMENLFYDREPHRRFDLKGSMRNRKIQSTGERDEVLQDENLVDIIFETPIFVREHAKKLLKASVWNDTLFLSKQNVMDYSLMAGFDDTKREIVVGIIDCIRTYTWDKKLETWIKDRGKNKPTITSPKDYRNRFRIAMSTYILQAPNCWHQFQAQQIQRRPLRLEAKSGAEAEGDAGNEGQKVVGVAL